MTPQQELEIDKASFAFAVEITEHDPILREETIGRIRDVKTRDQFNYLMAELRVELGDE